MSYGRRMLEREPLSRSPGDVCYYSRFEQKVGAALLQAFSKKFACRRSALFRRWQASFGQFGSGPSL